MPADLLVQKFAHISDCGLYRYRLSRHWGPGVPLTFVMLNPSTADAEIDDPTIRRCMGFARREGAPGIQVVNLYAYRATNPKELRKTADPFGPDNAAVLREVSLQAVHGPWPIICAWGASGADRGGEHRALVIFRAVAVELRCLGKTTSGAPRHPLYVRGDQPLEAFS